MNMSNDESTLYVTGRMIAIIEHYAAHKFGPNTLTNMFVHPAYGAQVFLRYVDTSDEYYKELADVELPVTVIGSVDEGKMMTGYYHQKAAYDRDAEPAGDFRQLTDECIRCIRQWKSENNEEPLYIMWGDYIQHCYNYGGDDIKNMYNNLFPDEEGYQDELDELERQLLFENVGEERGERIYFGQKLCQIRCEQGMTQQSLADASGVSRSHISRIESGELSASIDTLAKLAKALNTRLEFKKNNNE